MHRPVIFFLSLVLLWGCGNDCFYVTEQKKRTVLDSGPIVLFIHSEFNGACTTLNEGWHQFNPGSFYYGSISSFLLQPGYCVKVFDENNNFYEFDNSMYHLDDKVLKNTSWNDRITAIDLCKK